MAINFFISAMNSLVNSNLAYIFCSLMLFSNTYGQIGTNGDDRDEQGRPVKEYNLIIEKGSIIIDDISTNGMTINGTIPGPVLEFTEGDLAVINVTNKMDVETSVHWHGLILPNFYDGVPYLTTPPIMPGTTFQYRIPLNQSGTYWYHSHTMLQEQKGVFGSIIIHPKQKSIIYDKEQVIVLSDWTNEKPLNVLRNLKRGNEWYQIKKGTSVPLSTAIANGGLSAQLKMWRDRMEGADIADIYYPSFLTNGMNVATYPDFKSGEKVRLRFINASASSYFWVDFGAGEPVMVSSDGIDIEPVKKNRFLFAIAETYDVIVTIPNGTLEIKATAQDGSGHTTLRLGQGTLYPAITIDKPNKVDMIKKMAMMDMKMGAPAIIFNKNKQTPQVLMDKYGMKMNHSMDTNEENNMNMPMQGNHPQEGENQHLNHEEVNHTKMVHDTMMKPISDSIRMDHNFDYNERKKMFNYDFLKAKQKSSYNDSIPVNQMTSNLTGNMNRYIWSINGVPLSETDKLKIKGGEVTRITLNNLTMMHHPMHLHGHYFRVINKNGEFSPLKHTVNVPPMQKITIEFNNEEEGDWFFHCHVLYHMMSGMTRIFSYDTPRDKRMKQYSVKTLIDETNRYYSWGTINPSSNFTELMMTTSNIRNQFSLRAEIDYKENLEAEFNYDYYLNDWVRLYVGINSENYIDNSFNEFNNVGLLGIKYFTPYMFNVDISIDHQLRPRIRINREILLFPKIFIEGEYEYKADFGWVNNFSQGKNFESENEWLVRASYMTSRNISFQTNYNNQYGFGGGLTIRF